MDISRVVNGPSQESISQGACNRLSSAALTCARPSEGNHGKIEIPRLRGAYVGKKYRISHACSTCQEDKIKCDGVQPYCKRCAMLGKKCLYRPRKRERIMGDLNKLSEELNDYKYTLQVLHSRVDEDDLELIKNVLAKHSSAG